MCLPMTTQSSLMTRAAIRVVLSTDRLLISRLRFIATTRGGSSPPQLPTRLMCLAAALVETKSQSYPRLDFLQPVRREFFLSCTSSNMMDAQPIERENLQKEVFCSRGTDHIRQASYGEVSRPRGFIMNCVRTLHYAVF